MTERNDKVADEETEQPDETGRKADESGNRGRWGAAGLGAAIGSAAIVAALLYVNRSRTKDRK